MHLNELDNGENIKYQIKIKNNLFEFDGRVLGSNKSGLLLSPVSVNGRVFRFDNTDTSLSIIYGYENELPIIWENVTCQTITFDTRKIYRVSETSEGVQYNRRGAFRLNIMVNCVVKMCNDTKIEVAKLRDVSKTGFSVILDKDISDTINTGIRVMFTDDSEDINISGMVVRKASYSNGRVLYGCRLMHTGNNFNSYMSNKQREMIEYLQMGR